MNAENFVAPRRDRWAELESGLARTDRGRLRSLTATEIERLAVLYRRAASDLALARRELPDSSVTEYLNGLCGRAHVILHRGSPPRMQSAWRFFLTGVPRTFRAHRGYFAVSLMLLLLGALSGWLAFEFRPDLRGVLVPHSAFDEMAKGNLKSLGSAPGIDAWALFLHNIQVALVMFIFGVCLGLPTALLLFENGWILGTLGAAVHAGGYDLAFWSLIAAHGILELSIIVVAGAAGLRLGDAILRPGQRTRSRALADAAMGIIGMLIGIVILLVVAGITEAFVSPSTLPQGVKIAWGLTLGVAFYSWLLFSGRKQDPDPVAPSFDHTEPDQPLSMSRLPANI